MSARLFLPTCAGGHTSAAGGIGRNGCVSTVEGRTEPVECRTQHPRDLHLRTTDSFADLALREVAVEAQHDNPDLPIGEFPQCRTECFMIVHCAGGVNTVAQCVGKCDRITVLRRARRYGSVERQQLLLISEAPCLDNLGGAAPEGFSDVHVVDTLPRLGQSHVGFLDVEMQLSKSP
ncbi:hypothetical protein PQF33_50450 [Dactylosporangium aurantiacum]|nr:hypothetical protein [Dactylosporangium aurantiacum]MDG6110349.1 hypothetical protein [Dactylosporangium aurantiacum]